MVTGLAVVLALFHRQTTPAAPNPPLPCVSPSSIHGACPEAAFGQNTAASDVLQMIDAEKEPSSALAQIIRDAVERLQSCPADEASWYELIRGAEMREEKSSGKFEFSVIIAGRRLASLADATAEAVHQVPDSPRIALIDARVRAEPQHAATMLARFPEFAPLRLALAHAQLESGNAEAALEALAKIKDVKALPGAIGTLAAAKLAKGDPMGALKVLFIQDRSSLSAKVAGCEAYERTGLIDRERAEVSYQAQLALHHPAAALRPLLDAAELGSIKAQALLKRPDRALAKVIAVARKAGNLNAIDQDYLHE